jgi:hypothetical protein
MDGRPPAVGSSPKIIESVEVLPPRAAVRVYGRRVGRGC